MARLRAIDVERRKTSGQGKDFLEVLYRSIEVITAMGGDQQSLTLSDISRLTGLPRPSVGRILHTLCVLGYAESVGRTFRLTPKIVGLATAYLGAGGTSRILQQACDELSMQTGQSSLIGVLDGLDVLVVAYTMPRHLMAPYLGVGARFPAFCTAAGRVLLSGISDDALDDLLADIPRETLSQAGCGEQSEIKQEVIKARNDGFSVMDDGYNVGWHTISYPVFRYGGSEFGVLSLNCKKTINDGEDFSPLYEKCREQAQNLSKLIVD